jgi:hypothetical protein
MSTSSRTRRATPVATACTRAIGLFDEIQPVVTTALRGLEALHNCPCTGASSWLSIHPITLIVGLMVLAT